jgi:hypothetical protein
VGRNKGLIDRVLRALSFWTYPERFKKWLKPGDAESEELAKLFVDTAFIQFLEGMTDADEVAEVAATMALHTIVEEVRLSGGSDKSLTFRLLVATAPKVLKTRKSHEIIEKAKQVCRSPKARSYLGTLRALSYAKLMASFQEPRVLTDSLAMLNFLEKGPSSLIKFGRKEAAMGHAAMLVAIVSRGVVEDLANIQL